MHKSLLMLALVLSQRPAVAADRGEEVYVEKCAACHQPKGEGVAGGIGGRFPALANSAYVSGDARVLISVILSGRGGMPAFRNDLNNDDLSAVASFVRTTFNKAAPVTAEQVKAVRDAARPPAAANSTSAPANATNSESGVIRYTTPGARIAQAVEISPGVRTIFFSGMVPPMANPDAPRDSRAMWGDTRTQTVAIFTRMKETLAARGVGLGDIVKLQAFLVGDSEKQGQMDFAGFNEGYAQFFGTADQPNLPSRSVMQVVALANPGWLVEIEVTVAK
jgi:enamine deaminase RidA (YjgF/YER057c/UK114 family)/cytochrome c5